MKLAGSSLRHATRAVALGSLLAVCTALPASAGDFSRAGFYLGAGGSYTTDLYENEIEDAIAVPGVRVDVESTPGVNTRFARSTVGVTRITLPSFTESTSWLPERYRAMPSAEPPISKTTSSPERSLGLNTTWNVVSDCVRLPKVCPACQKVGQLNPYVYLCHRHGLIQPWPKAILPGG